MSNEKPPEIGEWYEQHLKDAHDYRLAAERACRAAGIPDPEAAIPALVEVAKAMAEGWDRTIKQLRKEGYAPIPEDPEYVVQAKAALALRGKGDDS